MKKQLQLYAACALAALAGGWLAGQVAAAEKYLLRMIFENQNVPPLFVETWTPSENNRERDVALDQEWLSRSLTNLRDRLAPGAFTEQ